MKRQAIRSLPFADVGRQIGRARTGLGLLLLARPVAVGRFAGADVATARRVTWLTRMTAARDLVLGVGTLRGIRAPGDAARWLAAGAAADLADAVILAGAVRQGRVGRLRGAVMVATAAGGALAGGVAAGGLRAR